MDGWVFRLALPTPKIFGLTSPSANTSDAEARQRAPKRLEIAGHFIHFDNGAYRKSGDYWSTSEDVERTAERVAQSDK